MEKPTRIASFNELAPADAIVTRLKAAGVDSHIHDETDRQHWQLWNLKPRAHLHVCVAVGETARSIALLKEWAAEGGDAAAAVRCPECGSFRIEYPQFSRKTLMGALPSLLATAGVIDQNFYCEDCHFTWPGEPPKPEPELDILNWPKK